jgi:hypothetical protein
MRIVALWFLVSCAVESSTPDGGGPSGGVFAEAVRATEEYCCGIEGLELEKCQGLTFATWRMLEWSGTIAGSSVDWGTCKSDIATLRPALCEAGELRSNDALYPDLALPVSCVTERCFLDGGQRNPACTFD